MAVIYFEMPQKSDGTEVGERQRWMDRHMIYDRNMFMVESGARIFT